MTTTTLATPYQLANGSFNRCSRSDGFFDTFYAILKASHPDIEPMFAGTDFRKQNELLRVSLGLMMMFDHGNDAAKQALASIRRSHSRPRLNVRPELYDYWIDSLVKAAAEHDPDFNADTEAAWRQVMDKGISYIKSGYNEGAGAEECMAYLSWIDPNLEIIARTWPDLPASVRADIVARVKSAK